MAPLIIFSLHYPPDVALLPGVLVRSHQFTTCK